VKKNNQGLQETLDAAVETSNEEPKQSAHDNNVRLAKFLELTADPGPGNGTTVVKTTCLR
jgi:hypothetical protein